MDWTAIDLPNLLAGAILGYALSLPQLFSQKRKERRQIGVEWTKELVRLEPVLGNPETRWEDLHTALSDVPIDHYRRVLGPDDFRLVENLQNAYAGAEHNASELAEVTKAHYRTRMALPPDWDIHNYAMLSRVDPAKYGDAPAVRKFRREIEKLHADARFVEVETQAIVANRKLNDLKVAVMNRGRERSRDEYADLLRREDRAKNLRHPIAWLKNHVRGWRRRRKMKHAAN